MREILFKAKTTDNNRWVEGYYIHLHKTTYCCIPDKETELDNNIHQIVYEEITDWGLPNKYKRVDINIDTLCQYTELKDIDGKRIFENDIIECVSWNEFFTSGLDKPLERLKRKFKVVFYQGCFCLKEIYDDPVIESLIGSHYWSFSDLNSPNILESDYRIIGNVFDNTELFS